MSIANSELQDKLIKNDELLEQVKGSWLVIFDYLTFIGFGRDALYENFDEQFGSENWLPAHFFNDEIVPVHEYETSPLNIKSDNADYYNVLLRNDRIVSST